MYILRELLVLLAQLSAARPARPAARSAEDRGTHLVGMRIARPQSWPVSLEKMRLLRFRNDIACNTAQPVGPVPAGEG